MLIFGKSVSDWREKAKYAEDKGENEYAKLHEVRCEGIKDAKTAFAAMAAFAADTNCKQFLYHATINLNPGERLSHEQWQHAVDTLEKNLNLTGHYRVIFEHIKKSRQHYHIVWSRIPPEASAAVNMGNNYYIHQNTAKALEREFGLKASPRKDNKTPSKKKQENDARNGNRRINPDTVTEDATRAFIDSHTAEEFIKNLSEGGYVLTRGKNGSLVLVDRQGGYHGLVRRLDGINIGDLRRKFPTLEKTNLPLLKDVLKSHNGAVLTKKGKSFAKGRTRGRANKIKAARPSKPRVHGTPIYSLNIGKPIQAAFAKSAWLTSTPKSMPRQALVQPNRTPVEKKGWPLEAIVMWDNWGRKNPTRFFSIWPELLPLNFVLNPNPN